MTWNHRVIEFVEQDGTPWRGIHEVHYDEDGNPRSYSETAAIVQWDLEEDPQEIIKQFNEALGKPVLIEKDFG